MEVKDLDLRNVADILKQRMCEKATSENESGLYVYYTIDRFTINVTFDTFVETSTDYILDQNDVPCFFNNIDAIEFSVTEINIEDANENDVVDCPEITEELAKLLEK